MIIDLDQQIACVQREIGLRKRAYPRWIQLGKMTQPVADEQLASMEAVLVTLQKLRDERRAKANPGLFA